MGPPRKRGEMTGIALPTTGKLPSGGEAVKHRIFAASLALGVSSDGISTLRWLGSGAFCKQTLKRSKVPLKALTWRAGRYQDLQCMRVEEQQSLIC